MFISFESVIYYAVFALAAIFVGGLDHNISCGWFPISQDQRVALSFTSPGYELFAEADAQGLTVSTERQHCKINSPQD